MTDKEQIEEMIRIIDNGTNTTCFSRDKEHTKCGDCEECWTYAIAKILSSAGYHKTIWHKVADRDFPTINKKVLFKLAEYDELTVRFYREDGLLDLETFSGFYSTGRDVIAWTELPEYKE